jgi:SAM-dependent methyltransferase
MNQTGAQIAFGLWLVKKRLSRPVPTCPYCAQSSRFEPLGNRRLMTFLGCGRCGLIFRHPWQDSQEAKRYYERWYTGRRASEIPDDEELQQAMSKSFRGTNWDLSNKIDVFRKAVPGSRVVEWGSSWGYTLVQLEAVGLDAVGIEVSESRARFGREKLGLKLYSDIDTMLAEFGPGWADAVFSNHVLEHLGGDLRSSLQAMHFILREGGVAFHVLPNFEAWRAGRLPGIVGRDHPIGPTSTFLATELPKVGFEPVVTGTGPFDAWLGREIHGSHPDSLDRKGDEAFVLAWRK